MNSSANGINHGYMYSKGYRWLITLEDGRTLYGKTLVFCSELMRTDFKDEKNFVVTSLYDHTESKWAQRALTSALANPLCVGFEVLDCGNMTTGESNE
jgi:hypothetical protein